jgi:hypothetical protein
MLMAISHTSHEDPDRWFGLSTDTKPSGNIQIGSWFDETDTQHGFVYDGAAWARRETVVVEQAAKSIVVKEALSTDDLLGEIVRQLKIQNAQLALVTGEELGETDIPAEVR